MNTISTNGAEFKRPVWQSTLIITLGFWLSASLILDWVIMPSLYVSGMMTQASFATAGYTIFWNFNRVELVCAGLVLTGVLVLTKSQFKRSSIILATMLLAIALVDTYLLTPQMSAIGLQLNWFEVAETPATMNLMHGAYWFIEAVKLAVAGTLFTNYCKQ